MMAGAAGSSAARPASCLQTVSIGLEPATGSVWVRTSALVRPTFPVGWDQCGLWMVKTSACPPHKRRVSCARAGVCVREVVDLHTREVVDLLTPRCPARQAFAGQSSAQYSFFNTETERLQVPLPPHLLTAAVGIIHKDCSCQPWVVSFPSPNRVHSDD